MNLSCVVQQISTADLADTGHPRMDAPSLPLSSFHSSLPKKEVHLIIIRIVGVRNEMGANKNRLCEERYFDRMQPSDRTHDSMTALFILDLFSSSNCLGLLTLYSSITHMFVDASEVTCT